MLVKKKTQQFWHLSFLILNDPNYYYALSLPPVGLKSAVVISELHVADTGWWISASSCEMIREESLLSTDVTEPIEQKV